MTSSFKWNNSDSVGLSARPDLSADAWLNTVIITVSGDEINLILFQQKKTKKQWDF